ncbi:MAG: matrixin family metalloprotease [Candidatus Binatia bacterium]
MFDDPFDEIDDPVDCRGVLGIGGYCYADENRDVGGQTYKRIRVGKVTIANGWSGCAQWTPCNLGQIATHEIGHAIGLGHSDDPDATMAGTAHFDSRCAGLAADDLDGVRAVYPAPDPPTPTFTATVEPSATATPAPTSSATARPATPTATPLGARGIRGRVTYYASGGAVPGARIRLRGAGAVLVVTQGGGDYAVDQTRGRQLDRRAAADQRLGARRDHRPRRRARAAGEQRHAAARRRAPPGLRRHRQRQRQSARCRPHPAAAGRRPHPLPRPSSVAPISRSSRSPPPPRTRRSRCPLRPRPVPSRRDQLCPARRPGCRDRTSAPR